MSNKGHPSRSSLLTKTCNTIYE